MKNSFTGLLGRCFSLAACAAGLFAVSSSAQASLAYYGIDLGAANNFTAESLHGSITVSNPVSGFFPSSGGTTATNVGVASSGERYSASGNADLAGNLYVHTGSTVAGGSNISGATMQGGSSDQLLAQSITDATNASTLAAKLTPNITINTGSVINDNTSTINGHAGLNVLNVSGITFNGQGTLYINAPTGSAFVINVTGSILFNNQAKFLLEGGISQNDVLFNVVGSSGTVDFTGGLAGQTPNTQLQGTILAINTDVGLHPGLVDGRIISGGDLALTSGGMVINGCVVPEYSAGWVVAPFMAGILLLSALRKKAAAQLRRLVPALVAR